MLSKTFYAGSVLVPSQGWLIYGGADSTLPTAQQLKSLNGKWEAGPALFEGKPDRNNCLVQVQTFNFLIFGTFFVRFGKLTLNKKLFRI